MDPSTDCSILLKSHKVSLIKWSYKVSEPDNHKGENCNDVKETTLRLNGMGTILKILD